MMKRRSRIVSFRLSDEEYDSLKNVSATRGARSVSEFTRSVACNPNSHGPEKLEKTIRVLNERMAILDSRLQMLTEALQKKAPEENTENTGNTEDTEKDTENTESREKERAV